jgi:hypothetical protein
LALFAAWPATTTAAVETTIKVKAANMMPINFKPRLSAIAEPPFRGGREKPRRHSGSGLSFLQQFHLVNNANQVIADAADNDHGRDGPEQKNWHLRFLLVGCPRHETQVDCHLFPIS